MEVNKNKNQKNKIIGIASLKEALSALKVADLQDIRKKLQIKNISSMKKAELIQSLAEAIPVLFRNIISQFDERRLFLIKNIIANNGVMSANNLEIEEMEYLIKLVLCLLVFKMVIQSHDLFGIIAFSSENYSRRNDTYRC